jgi:hypothetical protein
VNVSQTFLQTSLAEVEREYEKLVTQNDITLPPNLEATLEGLKGLEAYLATSCKHYKMWQILISLHRGWGFAVLALSLVAYNIIRFFLTQTVSAYRDEEERSGYTPRLDEYFTPMVFNRPSRYGLSLTRLHVILRGLFIVATSAFLINLVQLLWLGVQLRP